MAFKVETILNQNTIGVNPRWSWKGYVGNSVKIKGFNLSDGETEELDKETEAFIITKLGKLLLGKDVELKNPADPLKSSDSVDPEVTVSVYLNGVDISVYFPELKIVA